MTDKQRLSIYQIQTGIILRRIAIYLAVLNHLSVLIRVAKTSSTTGTFYFHKDHLGSSSAMTTDTGIIVETTNYMPFGEQREHTGSNISNYKFTDQELDPETGLYYYGARYYDPIIGRFISPDSVVQDPFDPQTLNRYAYCRNNPVIYTDPTGHYFDWVSAIISSAIASHIAACSTAYNGGDPEAVMKAANIGGGIGFISGYTGGLAGGWATTALGGKVAGGIVGGMVGGAVGGALNAAVYGGNIGEAALYGAIGGAIGGGLGAGLGNGPWGVTAKIAAAGVVGGTIAELSGGKFSQGALPAMFGAAVSIGIGEMIDNNNADKGVGGPSSKQKALYDIDPNGVEFTNPTGGDMRGCDSQGCGHYGASRGNRLHLGIDIESIQGQDVVSPFSGTAYNINSSKYPGVQIRGKDYTSDVLYIKASPQIVKAGAKGFIIKEGAIIGTANNITKSYPNITNHIHFQLRPAGSNLFINPKPYIFP